MPASCRSSTCCARSSWSRSPRFSCSTRRRPSRTRATQLRFLMGRDADAPFEVERAIPRPETAPIDPERAAAIALEQPARPAAGWRSPERRRRSARCAFAQSAAAAVRRELRAHAARDGRHLSDAASASTGSSSRPSSPSPCRSTARRSSSTISTRSSIATAAGARSTRSQRQISDDVKRAAAGARPVDSRRGGGRDQRPDRPQGSRRGPAALRARTLEQPRRRHRRKQPARGREPAHPGARRCRDRACRACGPCSASSTRATTSAARAAPLPHRAARSRDDGARPARATRDRRGLLARPWLVVSVAGLGTGVRLVAPYRRRPVARRHGPARQPDRAA